MIPTALFFFLMIALAKQGLMQFRANFNYSSFVKNGTRIALGSMDFLISLT